MHKSIEHAMIVWCILPFFDQLIYEGGTFLWLFCERYAGKLF